MILLLKMFSKMMNNKKMLDKVEIVVYIMCIVYYYDKQTPSLFI